MKLTAQIGENYLVSNQFNEHTTLSDQPVDVGGTNKAMGPTALFLASIASCKLITMKMVANRKDWNMLGLSIELELIKTDEANEIRQTIVYPNDLNDTQKLKLQEISHKCPMVKLLSTNFIFTDAN